MANNNKFYLLFILFVTFIFLEKVTSKQELKQITFTNPSQSGTYKINYANSTLNYKTKLSDKKKDWQNCADPATCSAASGKQPD